MRSRPPVVFVALAVLASSCAWAAGTPAAQSSTSLPAVTSAPLPAATSTSAVIRPQLVIDTAGAILAPAVRVETRQVAPDPFVPAVTTPASAQCPQWWELARSVGWPEDALLVLDHVMMRESRCNPAARNTLNCAGSSRSEPHARGLTQLCGWTCNGTLDGCLDAEANLRRALQLYEQLGWRPWCYNDGVTPRC